MSQPWDVNSLQFPRLLAELRAIGLTDAQYGALDASMSCDRDDIDYLLERAEEEWQAIKYLGQVDKYLLGTPPLDEGRIPAGPVTAKLNAMADDDDFIDPDPEDLHSISMATPEEVAAVQTAIESGRGTLISIVDKPQPGRCPMCSGSGHVTLRCPECLDG